MMRRGLVQAARTPPPQQRSPWRLIHPGVNQPPYNLIVGERIKCLSALFHDQQLRLREELPENQLELLDSLLRHLAEDASLLQRIIGHALHLLSVAIPLEATV